MVAPSRPRKPHIVAKWMNQRCEYQGRDRWRRRSHCGTAFGRELQFPRRTPAASPPFRSVALGAPGLAAQDPPDHLEEADQRAVPITAIATTPRLWTKSDGMNSKKASVERRRSVDRIHKGGREDRPAPRRRRPRRYARWPQIRRCAGRSSRRRSVGRGHERGRIGLSRARLCAFGAAVADHSSGLERSWSREAQLAYRDIREGRTRHRPKADKSPSRRRS